MTEDAAQRWATDLRAAISGETFFGSCNFYAYVAGRT
jgi:hypothetical protein